MTLRRCLLLTVTLSLVCAVPALADDVPDALQGTWASGGACNVVGRTIDIIGNTLAVGTGAPSVVTYVAGDSPQGNDAIHYAEEGDVSNFEYIPDADELDFHPEGYGMGSTTAYRRCDDPGMHAGADAQSSVTRCGWYAHLNEGDYNLIDGDGNWILGKNGQANVGGYDSLPYVNQARDYVSTGGSLGYACICMSVTMNPGGAGISSVESSRFVPIRQCKADPHLSDPSTW